MKKTMLGMIAVLIACALISCSPSGGTGPIIIGGNGGSGTEAALTDVANNIDEGKALIDAMNDAEGTDIGYLNGPASASIMALSADDTSTTGSKTVYIRVTFSGYDNGSCTINSGHIDYTLTVNAGQTAITNSNVAYTASASNLSVSVSGSSRGSITVTGTGLAGTISEINATEAEGNITLTISDTAESTPSKTQGSYSSGNTTVSNAEASGAAEGGDGTEANPYEISTAEQLLSLPFLAKADGTTTYVEIIDDISFPADKSVGAISDFDISGAGNGIRITLEGPAGSGNDLYWVFSSIVDSKISNINYEMKEKKAFIGTAKGNVALEDITIDGDITIDENNTSAFMVYARPISSTEDSSITFTRCISKVDFTDETYSYGAPFVAFTFGAKAEGESGVNFIFDSCRNEGDIFYGNWASILIGNANSSQGYPKSVAIQNGFVNTGTISSFGTIAFCSHHKASDEKLTGKESVIGFDDSYIDQRSNEGITITGSDGKPTNLTVTNSSIQSIRLVGCLYVGFLDEANEEIAHLASYTIPLLETSRTDNFAIDLTTIEVIGSTLYNGEEPSGSLVEYNGKSYWYAGPLYDGLESKAGGKSDTDGIAGFSKIIATGLDSQGKSIVQIGVETKDIKN